MPRVAVPSSQLWLRERSIPPLDWRVAGRASPGLTGGVFVPRTAEVILQYDVKALGNLSAI